MKRLVYAILILMILTACKSETETTCRQVSEPYQEIEEYTEQEAYNEEGCVEEDYRYSLENVKNTRVGSDIKLEYDIVNEDSETIVFRGGATWIIGGTAVIAKLDPKVCCEYIVEPGETITITKVYEDGQLKLEGEPSIIMPKKESCDQVTKYRTVTKTRNVTKYRNQTVCE
ncbi:hypothetical protein KY312_04670 [Candidatus Woesearchaeota archaeon]|nr:hypothetical protein [Candidatus Woesearchaeota archaeon]